MSPADKRRESGVTPQGTPFIKRVSLVPENPDDLVAHQRLQGLRAPNVEELKKQNKVLQKLCGKQDKELQKLQTKYNLSVKQLEEKQTKERERFILEQEKNRAGFEKKKMKGSALNLPSEAERDLDELIKSQENQRWSHIRKQANLLAFHRREHYAREHEVNKRYHEHFYRTLDNEIQQQQVALNEQLKNINSTNVNEMMKKLSQQASKELHELKQKKGVEKAQLDQIRDDLTQKNIRQGVSIAKKYEMLCEDRRKVLAEVSLGSSYVRKI